jgi:hypothetical protein
MPSDGFAQRFEGVRAKPPGEHFALATQNLFLAPHASERPAGSTADARPRGRAGIRLAFFEIEDALAERRELGPQPNDVGVSAIVFLPNRDGAPGFRGRGSPSGIRELGKFPVGSGAWIGPGSFLLAESPESKIP